MSYFKGAVTEIQLKSLVTPNFTVTTAATNLTLYPITIIDVKGDIIAAFLDFHCRKITNSFAGANGLDGDQIIKVDDGTRANANAIPLGDSNLTVATSTSESGDFIIPGTTDCADMVKGVIPGNSLNITWVSSKVLHNSLVFTDVYSVLRLIVT